MGPGRVMSLGIGFSDAVGFHLFCVFIWQFSGWVTCSIKLCLFTEGTVRVLSEVAVPLAVDEHVLPLYSCQFLLYDFFKIMINLWLRSGIL